MDDHVNAVHTLRWYQILYEYITSLTTIRKWLGKDIPQEIECGHFLPDVPYPVYRVPCYENAIVKDTTYVNCDHLFDITEDEGQTKEITDPDIINRMEHLMIQAMKEHHAPHEQYQRLGLI